MDGTPSGNTGLADESLAQGVKATLTATATYLASKYAFQHVDTNKLHLPTLWDLIAATQFAPLARARVDEDQAVEPAAVEADEEDDIDQHHTIPIYLCGSVQQVTAGIPEKAHYQIHRDLAALTVVAEASALYADKVLQLKRRRTKGVLALAQTQEGRVVIAGVLESYYRRLWWELGMPTIGDAFTIEKFPYISGVKTSVPRYCSRANKPMS